MVVVNQTQLGLLEETKQLKEGTETTAGKSSVVSEIVNRKYYYPEFYQDMVIDPGFFKLERKGKILYVFGTCHYFPMKILPEAYLKLIHTCKQAFFENISTLTEQEYVNLGFLKKRPQPRWNKWLTPIAEEIFKNAFQIWCHNSRKTRAIENANPKMAFWICHKVAITGGMDEELAQLFGDKVEPLDTRNSLTSGLKEFAIEETNKILENQFGYLRNHPCYNADCLEFDKQYLAGKYLYDREFIKAEAEEDMVMVVNRNKMWFPKLNQVNFEQPTFVGVGFAHLVGRSGLLYLMENAGWKLSRINREGREEPIVAARLFPDISRPILSGFRNFLKNHSVEIGLGAVGLVTAGIAATKLLKKK